MLAQGLYEDLSQSFGVYPALSMRAAGEGPEGEGREPRRRA
jgi:hypothetical protein